ncbi:MAG: type II toxin-antitoxin system VapC family toxin [Thermomicrobiales bacterium]
MTDGAFGPVLDASALLAYLQAEPGAETVEEALIARAVISTINYAEVLSRLGDAGQDPESVHRHLRSQGLIGGLLEVLPLHENDGVVIAQLRASTRTQGLSLGDRACLATGLRLDRPVLTADRAWSTVRAGVTVLLIRP